MAASHTFAALGDDYEQYDPSMSLSNRPGLSHVIDTVFQDILVQSLPKAGDVGEQLPALRMQTLRAQLWEDCSQVVSRLEAGDKSGLDAGEYIQAFSKLQQLHEACDLSEEVLCRTETALLRERNSYLTRLLQIERELTSSCPVPSSGGSETLSADQSTLQEIKQLIQKCLKLT